jgi:hypothetical protein
VSGAAEAQGAQAKFGLAQAPAYKNQVTGLCAGTENCLAFAHLAENGNVDENFLTPRRVSASQPAAKMLRGAPQAREKLIQPAAGMGSRKSQTEQETSRLAAHGGDVTYGARQTFPPYRVRGMLSAPEMRSLQEPVAGEYGLAAGPGPPKGGVVPRSQAEGGPSRATRPGSRRNLFDQSVLCGFHRWFLR